MQIKYLLLIALLLAVTNQVTVTKTDQCDDCTQFKSSADCKSFGCTWTDKTATTAGSCAKTTTPPPVAFTPYCQTIETANCSKTFGCALVEGKCTHFTGCSAYVKTTHKDCQDISYMCITNGVTCAPALECVAYTKEQCEATPSLKSPFKCKLDGETCRDYKCSEADTSLTTNAACSGWLAGCRTTGAGCIDIIPPCASYQGTSETCPKMRGTDGNCEFNPDGNNCRVRLCTGADASLNTNEACATYQTGCVTTGKGCVATLGSCSSYDGNASTCIGYIGTDGECAGDATGTKCRARKCDEKTATTDEECNKWKPGCKSNGRSCVDALGLCNTYDGTITTCAGLKGTDGNCKGTSTTTAKCSVKDCAADSNATFTTQAQCTAIQSFCKTTGKGCVATLQNCSSYTYTDDGTSCNSLYGLDGRCKKAASGNNCAARVCTEAPTSSTTNKQCDEYKSDCVTTGAGCVARTVCQDTVKQITCEGTTNCGWNSICVSKTSCGQLLTKSICESVKINNKPCKWESNSCRNARCDDFTATDDNTCNTLLDGCVTNGTKCVDGTNCPAQFKGSQQTCQAFKAKCTNDNGAAETAACKARTCDDSYLTYDNDTDCGNYLTGCVTKGSGCIIDTAICSSYSGTPEQCDKFKGNKTNRCWNTSPTTGNCVDKLCTQATGMADDTACESFLSGCLYDGNGSCVDKSASCLSYTGDATTCLNFKGNNGANPCFVGSGGRCKSKACTDDSTSTSDGDCDTFLTGCVTDGLGCIAKTAPCISYSGTTEKCLTFTGNSSADKCTRLEACVSKSITCTSKTGVATNADCLQYHNDCRLKFGDTSCLQHQNSCTSYALSGSVDADKQTYCNSITTSGGAFCGYSTAVTGTCSARACNLWVSTLTGISCVDYAGTASCRLNGTHCYAANVCTSYVIPTAFTTATEKLTFCNAMLDNTATPKACTYDSVVSTVNCSNIDSCEEIINPTSAASCNLYFNDRTCQFAGGKCITTKTACTGYSLTGITTTNAAAYCTALRQLNTSVVTQCKYAVATTTNCVAKTCADISSPTSQASCDNGGVPNCKYYQGACYAIVACTAYTFPASADNATKKQNYCQNMYESGSTDYCSYNAAGNSGAGACAATKAACTDYTGLTAAAAAGDANDIANKLTCSKLRITSGSACAYIQSEAANTTCHAPADAAAQCTVVTSDITADADCDLRTTVGFCKKDGSNPGCAARSACTAVTPTGSDDEAKNTFCQANYGPDGLYCQFVTGASACAVAPDTCANWSTLPASGKLAFCQARIAKDGTKCSWSPEATACRDYNCDDAINPSSQADCDAISAGCKYSPQNRICYTPATPCTAYKLPIAFTTQAEKQSYCNNMTTSDGAPLLCTYVTGAACAVYDACASYTVSGLADFDTKFSTCQNLLANNGPCTYFSGNTCVAVAGCDTYTGGTAGTIVADCAKQKDGSGKLCFGASAACIAATCADVTGATSIADCNKYVTGCVYYNNKCYAASSTCAYTTDGSTAISFCNGIKNTNGDFCTADANTDATCRQRACTDSATVSFQTHLECKTYYSLCKSDGQGCIDSSVTCGTQTGYLDFCNWAFDTDNKSTCAKGTLATTDASCTKLTCEMNVTATTDSECQSFHSDCLTKGNGCIHKTEACSSYYGTKEQCQSFTGNSKKCFGDSATTKVACRDRQCSDLPTATNDSDCENFLTGCLFNGVGCVSKSAACSSYKGTQDTCKGFKGNNGNKLCWGTSATVVNSCTERKCSDLAGTTDKACQDFLPPIAPSTAQLCITNGTACVDIGKPCSFFKGNDETCGLFTATDGPCKASAVSAAAVVCTPRVCYEAPNTFTTDQQCSNYYPGCKTTGRGCKSSISCGDYTSSTSCTANTSCQWAGQCRALTTTCGSLTALGQTVCVNTPLQNAKRCAWFIGANNTSGCRDFTCADYDGTITTHKDCYDKDTSCTTTGAGCVTIGTCSTYRSKSVCENANTTETSLRCTWNSTTAACRQRQCADGQFATDDVCNTFLAGCKTSGTACVGPNFGCDVFSGNPKLCQKNSAGNPCLYVNGVCYDYDNCTDISNPSFNFCQAFSTQCVPTLTTCRAITLCDKYEDINSCLIGINNTKCGWLPEGKCKEFTTCGDAVGASLAACTSWGSKCVSDGTKCIDQGTCSSYLTTAACDNAGTDGFCQWSGTSCRLRECTDKVATSDAECLAYTVKSGLCTTDGTKCVARATCASYQSEAACTIGADGIPCVFDFPVGQTTGTKSCRSKECSDIKGTTNDACVGQIPNKACVSNGVTCVKQDACANYKNKLSCKAGGSDGKCAFTPAPTVTDPNNGTCQLFKSCENANTDQDACNSKPKACKWTSTTTGTTTTTKCSVMDCPGVATGTTCNPIPSFDGSTNTVCVLANNVCTAGDPSTISQDQCYRSTVYSYTWNEATNKCVGCKSSSQNNNNNNTTNTNTTNNGTNTDDNGYILGVTIPLIILGVFA
ncbi:unnamed protein product [Paramecium sonneborni]|uniref:Uncharacterized protein n=1 Tax=Paramecium sonneborni TaxID=65129 RepID=A0A8S1R594_9CILI|nr:unnamed protein product [Paramecium sonneborni]